jgi:N-acetylhexosamine 1-kinase
VTKTRLSAEPPVALANRIAARFDLPGPVEAHDFPEKGNINRHTYAVESWGAQRQQYLLQQINQQVFTRPRAVMAAMIACIEAQRANLGRGLLAPGEPWEPVTLVPTRDGRPFLEVVDRRGSACWRLMVRIAGASTYKSLAAVDPGRRLMIAEQAGAGLAIFGTLSGGVDVSRLGAPLPGYRDTQLYYDQLLSVLAGHRTLEAASPHLPADQEVRQATQQHFLVHVPPDEYRRRVDDPGVRPFVDFLRDNAGAALLLARALGSGDIRRTLIHGDTKLENFLFDAGTGRVKALVDLDTIMAHTWLSDFGDMVRSLCNVAGEREADPAKIQVDMEVYRAVATGFLRSARNVTARELDLMVDAVEVIAIELGMRFLTDYLRGDSYFRLGPADPPDLNRIRGLAQLTLAERLRARADEARALVSRLRTELGVTCVS